MKITIVAQRFPYPLDKGDKLTIYHLIKFLSKRHQVTLVCFKERSHNPAWDAELQPYCERIETLPENAMRAYANCALGFFDSLPLQVHYSHDPAMTALVDRVVKETEPDLLYAHYIRMGRYVLPYTAIPRVLAMQLSMTLNYERLANNAKTWFHRLLFSTEHKKLMKFEAEFARQFDQVMLISQRDLAAVNASPPLENVFFNPHGVDFDYFAPDTTVPKEQNSLVFTGNMNYRPNVDGAVYFCTEVLPLIKKRIPTVRVYLVGADPTAEVQALADDPAVSVTGRVPDLRQYMRQSEIAIAPMRITAGLLNKVLEALSMELPMVVTPQANEGIDAENGKHLVIADTAQGFADETIKLLEDPARREQLGTAGRKFIQQKWSWDAHLEDLEQTFVDLTKPY
ncbi:MAG: TIGR03087 family PEP-CTERM/XrtA system glycosyltransferase [Acidiferrobacterales bacterium]|nr:TIGR03087 family PEP-CTERM/XrtA system glycosyltransferase [Acidiferrobacterales bacterium]